MLRRNVLIFFILFSCLSLLSFGIRKNEREASSVHKVQAEFFMAIVREKKNHNVSVVFYDHGTYSVVYLSSTDGANFMLDKFKKNYNISFFEHEIYITSHEMFYRNRGQMEYSSNIQIQNLSFRMDENKVMVSYDPYEFLFYDASNVGICHDQLKSDFIYFYRLSRTFSISLCDQIKILFYHSEDELSPLFQDEIFSTWLDTNIVSYRPFFLIIDDDGYHASEGEC